ncbi:hypothetical protein IQ251_12655 [Saccharopolyspora sp. HNM0983]|uniref:CRISPR-associated protein Csx10 n=1 Tax=Saccharopolyspora montiporae TaxID=2781240 RepID=A0A929BBG9_9PSEU|nr:type III-B CRISPR module-associated Cmr3 family protein [Saccharopolyspora sp. HNM0983]MBE9375295.1 hypothetical protein [Saccharopolyspora sp. HNM0983]
MTEYARLVVTLDEPVAAGRNLRSDFRRDIHDHVPGSVLRGALAAAWIQWLGVDITRTREFGEIFDGQGSFGPLHSVASYPVPLSVFVHKYGHTDKCRKLWWDAALDETAAGDMCEKCKYPLVASKGQPAGPVAMHSRTMSALRTDGVAKDGNLFSETALTGGMRLSGWLHGDALRALESADVPLDTLYLGSRRSLRGSATVEVDRTAVPDPVEAVGNDVILRLAAPGIFVDEFGMPRATPDLDELSEVLGVQVIDVRPWIRWTEAGGWHAASGLPKPTERAVAPGSTFRVQCAEPPAEAARRSLTARGVGLRRREGFGALHVPSVPLPPAALVGKVAGVNGDADLLDKLHARTWSLRLGQPDNTPFEDDLRSDRLTDYVKDALRTMLEIPDAATYENLLTTLENLCKPR